jgi:serine/threonine protein phosphatase PrpC
MEGKKVVFHLEEEAPIGGKEQREKAGRRERLAPTGYRKPALPSPFWKNVRVIVTADDLEKGTLPEDVVCFDEDQGPRESMEDQALVAQLGPDAWLYAVLDGHGGKDAADYFANRIAATLLEYLQRGSYRQSEDKIRMAITAAFLSEDKRWFERNRDDWSGTTFTGVLVTPSALVTINLGDSRTLIQDTYGTLRATVDQKPNEAGEKTRIEAAGGRVIKGYVNRYLAVARAFGDNPLKHKNGKYLGKDAPISPEPVVKLYPRLGGETILIGCDGVFDVMSNEEAMEIYLTRLGSCKAVVEQALARGSSDNVTVMAVKIPKKTPRIFYPKEAEREGFSVLRKEEVGLSLDHVEFASAKRRLSIGKKKIFFQDLFKDHAIALMNYIEKDIRPVVGEALKIRETTTEMFNLRNRISQATGELFETLSKKYDQLAKDSENKNNELRKKKFEAGRTNMAKAVQDQLSKWKRKLRNPEPFMTAMKRFIGLWINFAEDVGRAGGIYDKERGERVRLTGSKDGETKALEAIWKGLTGKNAVKGESWVRLVEYVQCIKQYLWAPWTESKESPRNECRQKAVMIGHMLDSGDEPVGSSLLPAGHPGSLEESDFLEKPAEFRLSLPKKKGRFVKLINDHLELEYEYIGSMKSNLPNVFKRLIDQIDASGYSLETFGSAMKRHATLLKDYYYLSKWRVKYEERALQEKLEDVELLGGGEKVEEGLGVPLTREHLEYFRGKRDEARKEFEGSNAALLAKTSIDLINNKATDKKKQNVKDGWEAHARCIMEYVEADIALVESGDDIALKRYVETRKNCKNQTKRLGEALDSL